MCFFSAKNSIIFTAIIPVLFFCPSLLAQEENDNDQVPLGTFEIGNAITGRIAVSPPLHFAVQIDSPSPIYNMVLNTNSNNLELVDGKASWNSIVNWHSKTGIGPTINAYDFFAKSADEATSDIYTLVFKSEATKKDLLCNNGPTEKYITIPNLTFNQFSKFTKITSTGLILHLVGVDLSYQVLSKFNADLEGGGIVLLNQDAKIESLNIVKGTTLEFDGSRTLDIQNVFTNTGNISLKTGAILTSPHDISNSGNINGTGNIKSFTVNNDSAKFIAQNGTLALEKGLSNSGFVDANENGILQVDVKTSNNGKITAQSDSTINLENVINIGSIDPTVSFRQACVK
jgi:hypothetical protein